MDREIVSSPRGWSGNEISSAADIVRQMAKLDYKQALKWSAAEQGAFDEVVRSRAFDQIVLDDIDLAIAHAGAPGGSSRLKRMAHRRLADGEREAAIRLLEAALDANLKSEPEFPGSGAEIISQAQIGAMAIAAGREEWGRKLVNAAADRVEALGQDDDAQARAAVAAALARYDAPRAVRLWVLLPSPSGGISTDVHSELAAVVGVYDLAAARRILTRAPTPSGFSRRVRAAPPSNSAAADFEPVLMNIARRLASTNPEQALTLLDGVGENAPLQKAEVLGRAAMALAIRDASRAYELFDRALSMCFAAPRQVDIVTNDRIWTAARIAVMAALADYPDMQTVVDQVLALRPIPAESVRDSLQSRATIEAAWLLAMIDAPVAREVLSRVSPPDVAVRNFSDATCVAHWLEAWLMIDVEHAVELFHQVLNDQSRSLTSECVSHGLLPMIDALSRSHNERLRMALSQPSPWWFPYTDE